MEGKSRIHWALDGRIPIVLMGALAKQFRDLIGDWASPNTLATLGGIHTGRHPLLVF